MKKEKQRPKSFIEELGELNSEELIWAIICGVAPTAKVAADPSFNNQNVDHRSLYDLISRVEMKVQSILRTEGCDIFEGKRVQHDSIA